MLHASRMESVFCKTKLVPHHFIISHNFMDFDDIVATISIFSGILNKADDIPQNKKGRSFKLGGTLRKGGQ